MAINYTTLLGLAQPVTGTESNVWGDVVNDSITALLDSAIAGTATISLTSGNVTLTDVDGAADQARMAILVLTGTPGVTTNVVAPSRSKAYIVVNQSDASAVIKGSATTGVAVRAGQAATCVWNGTDFEIVASGDVDGPASATNNAIPTFDGTTGKLIKDNSGATISAGVITATGFSGPLNGTVGATTPSTVVATQVDITAQGDLRLQDTTGGQFVALQAPSTIATSYTLTLPVDDGTSGQALITDGSGVLSWSSAASGDVYGPASATDNAVARYDGTTGKIIQNSAVTIADDGATVIAANSTSDALRITQLGTGNALLVEDAANPDATPVVIDNSGKLISGSTESYATHTNVASQIQLHTNVSSTFFSSIASANWVSGTQGAAFQLSKARSGTIGTQGIVQSSDILGEIHFDGSDGVQFIEAAKIAAVVDGTPGTNDMPGRLVFSTTADGASSPTERMRIDSSGRVGIGGTSGSDNKVNILGTLPSAGAGSYGVRIQATVPSATTSAGVGFRSTLSTEAATFSTNLSLFSAAQGSFGAGSTVTNQYGFEANSSLTGATNNYGFYSNIASGTGRWNFYANGTAANYFGGDTTISVNSTSDALRITQVGTGNALLIEDSANPDATPFVINSSGQVGIGTTFPTAPLDISGDGFVSSPSFRAYGASAGSYPNIIRGRGTQLAPVVVQSGDALGGLSFSGFDGTGNAVAALIRADVDGTPGTNDMPGRLVFSTTADGASSPTEKMRIDNQGRVGIGATPVTSTPFFFKKSATGNATQYIIYNESTVQSDVTTAAEYYVARANLQNTVFTLPSLTYFKTSQAAFGSATVTNQYGFNADSSLTGATNNYGFYSNIASGTGRWNFYAAGTADNYFAGRVGVGTTTMGGVLNLATGGTTDIVAALGGTFPAFTYRNGTGAWFHAGKHPTNDYFYIGNGGTPTTTINMAVASSGTISLGAAPGSESLRVTPVASAVNYLEAQGQITTGGPSLIAAGSDTNIDLLLKTKGTGSINAYTSGSTLQFRISHAASAVNYLQVNGGGTGGGAAISTQGSDTNIPFFFGAKGAGQYFFSSNNSTQFNIGNTASTVNYLRVDGGTAGNAATLSVVGSDTNISIALTPKGTGGVVFPAGAAATPSITTSGDTNTGIFFPAADTIAFSEGGVESMRITSAGNLGLGVTPSAASVGTFVKNFEIGAIGNTVRGDGSAHITIAANAYENSGWKYAWANLATRYSQQDGVHKWFTAPSGTAGNAISFTQAMTLLPSGELTVGTTTSAGLGGLTTTPIGSGAGSCAVLYWNKSNAGSEAAAAFRYNGSNVGLITYTSTAVAYNTTSDYRLKENVAPMAGALAKVAALKPCTYTWKADGSAGQGFIAHELQAVVPDCVTGEKDAVGKDGNPQYQGVDTSFLVATLTAAIQELKAEFDAYKLTHP